MFKNLTSSKKVLIIILLLALLFRIFRIWYPNAYVFDEVYHAFTAKEYVTGSKVAWEWWNTPPPGVAYEWTHPPIAKEIMALSLGLFHTTDAWGWRLPGVIMNLIAIYLVYQIALFLFKKEPLALTSAFLFSIDGLNFVQSRTGMNDIYVVTFMLASFFLFVKKRLFFSAVLFGLAIASKWAAVYLLFVFVTLIFLDSKSTLFEKLFKKIALYIIVPPVIYLLSYLPFFILGHTFDQFIQLQQQMWWYHTHLKAAHDYASAWWSWPFNLYPVWYYVQYFNNGYIANIFASGNLPLFIFGFAAILLSIKDIVFKKISTLAIIILGFLIFWLPWSVSPRIMFLYHYCASIPFMCIALGFQLNKLYEQKSSRQFFYLLLGLTFLGFLFYYPVLTGIALPKVLLKLFFFTNLTKNPFGSL